MKPLEFNAPNQMAPALELLSQNPSSAGLLAGGTDLIIQHRAGRKDLTQMIDLKHIPELMQLSYDNSTGLKLGGAVSCAELTEYGPACKNFPALAEGAELIGSTQIQSRATVGGNVCNGSPAADTICGLIVHQAQCILHSKSGARKIAAESVMTGPGKTALNPEEILAYFEIPTPAANSSSAYLRFIPRNEMDIAVAGVAVFLTKGADNRVAEARVCIGAVAPTPLMVPEAADALRGSMLEDSALNAAAKACEAAASPITDARGTAEYRRHVTGVLCKRAAKIAWDRIANPDFTLTP